MDKVCFKCKEEKPRSEFYPHKRMADGLLGKCKECTKRDVREDRRYSPNARAYDKRRYTEDPERKRKLAEGVKRRRRENPKKTKARNAVHNAVRDGRLIKPPHCSRCGIRGVKIEGHHEDYSKPLEVRWLCTLCHRRYYS